MKIIVKGNGLPTELFTALYKFNEIASKYEPGYSTEIKIEHTPNRVLNESEFGMTQMEN